MTTPQPRDASTSPRFAQVPSFMRLPLVEDARDLDVALLGVPFDGGVSYRPGPRFGPQEIRQHSRLIRPYNPVLGVQPFDVLRVADVGDVDVNPLDVVDTHARMERVLDRIISAARSRSASAATTRSRWRGCGPWHAGMARWAWCTSTATRTCGTCTTATGTSTAHRSAVPSKKACWTRAAFSRSVLGTGVRAGRFRLCAATRCARRPRRRHRAARDSRASRLRSAPCKAAPCTYRSISTVSTPRTRPAPARPEVGGLLSREALEVVRALTSLDLVAADLVEVSPPYDHANLTTMLAANILFEIVSVFAVIRQRASQRKDG